MTVFPQEYGHEFFGVVAIVSLISTVLLVWHMTRAWETFVSLGQRLRYLSLLAFSTLVVVAAVDQFQLESEVRLRHFGTATVLALLAVTLVVTYREEAERRRQSLPEKKRAS